MTTTIQAFAKVLENYDMQDIQGAFDEWLANQSRMPVPAEIKTMAASLAADRRMVSQKQTNRTSDEIYRPNGTLDISWKGKTFTEMTADDLANIRKHLTTLTKERADGYVLYLQSTCGFPREF